MSEASYFFIDGGYVRKKYNEAMKRVFGDGDEPDFATMQQWCYAQRFGNCIPQRFFYYDCLIDIKKDTETPQDFQRRVEHQTSFFKTIQSLPGFHVRLGSLTGTGKKIRQKKVDVLLAVEMLDNSFRKNMAVAVLFAGDGDFIPVAEAVIRLGTWVEVCYDPHGASEELYSIADKGVRLTFSDLWSWGSKEFRAKYPLPSVSRGSTPEIMNFFPRNIRIGKTGDGKRIRLAERGDVPGECFLEAVGPDSCSLFLHTSASVLEAYYAELHESIVWDKR